MLRVCEKDIRVYGRLIKTARLDADGFEFIDDLGLMTSALKQSPARIHLFTFIPRIAECRSEFRHPCEWDNVAALTVSTFDHWWNQQIDKKTRNMVRKAEKKGVTVREVAFDDVLVKGISNIYNECPVRQGKAFLHFGKDISTVRAECATFLDSSIFLGAYLDAELIGFAKLTWDERRSQIAIMNIVSMIAHRDKSPTNALIAEAVKVCERSRIPYLVYSRFDKLNQEQGTLDEFKSNNGFERIEIPRYYVPLTLAGAIGYRLGLHHRAVDFIPEQVRAKLRGFRAAWYNRKLQSA